MSAFPEPESGKLWFFTRNDTQLALAAANGVEALFVFMSRDQVLQASFRGLLRAALDPLHRDKYWSGAVAAWYPKGKDDPHLTMLSLDGDEAEVWISEAGPVKLGWEIAKANLTGSTPDVGGHATIKLG